MIIRDIVSRPLTEETWQNFDWFNDYHNTRRWVEKVHPLRNDLKAWLSDGWMRYSDECLRIRKQNEGSSD